VAKNATKKEENKIQKTSIEWVQNPDGTPGYTWNPITGCLNHINGMCEGGGFPCYAHRLANTRLKERYLANTNCPTSPNFRKGQYRPDADAYLDPFHPRFWIHRVRENFGACTSGAEPKGIFVCDMGDLFGKGVPEEWTRRVLSHIGMSWYKEHRFYLLTKQPQNLQKFSPFPDNCFVGVTITRREMAHFSNSYLPNIEAKVKYISFEPLLDDVTKYLYFRNVIKAVDWVILGSQTKPYKPPKIEWVESIIQAADKAGIKVFEKDNLKPLLQRELRQEMPL